MKPKQINHTQGRLFQQRLSFQLNLSHELIQLSKLIDWAFFEKEFSGLFKENQGASAKPVRLVVGIIMLQQMNGYSDEGAIDEWVENPYWQLAFSPRIASKASCIPPVDIPLRYRAGTKASMLGSLLIYFGSMALVQEISLTRGCSTVILPSLFEFVLREDNHFS